MPSDPSVRLDWTSGSTEAKRWPFARVLWVIGVAVLPLLLSTSIPWARAAQSVPDAQVPSEPDLEVVSPALETRHTTLSERLSALTIQVDGHRGEVEVIEGSIAQIGGALEDARESIAIGGLSQDLGRILLAHCQSLPDSKSLQRRLGALRQEQVALSLQHLQHRMEVRSITAPESASPSPRPPVEAVTETHLQLLRRAVALEDQALEQLAALVGANEALIAQLDDYDAFLDEHLLWARSSDPARSAMWTGLHDQLARLLTPVGWDAVGRALAYQA